MFKALFYGLALAFWAGCGGSGDADSAKCSDFANRREAQQYFNTHDAPQLDGDNDGLACEALPA